jgi:Holliday junction resolvase RusA-like endonuclease
MEVTQVLQVKVKGAAAPQGSKTAFTNKYTGRTVLVEASKKLKPWRAEVSEAFAQEAKAQGWQKIDKDVAAHVTVIYRFKKPKSVKRIHHTVKPDLDKLARGILDGITQSALVWADDSQAVSIFVAKEYGAEDETLIEVASGV